MCTFRIVEIILHGIIFRILVAATIISDKLDRIILVVLIVESRKLFNWKCSKYCSSELNAIRFFYSIFHIFFLLLEKDFDRTLFFIIIFYLFKLHIVCAMWNYNYKGFAIEYSVQVWLWRWNWKLIICNLKPNFPKLCANSSDKCSLWLSKYPYFYFDDDMMMMMVVWWNNILNEISNLQNQYNILYLPHWPHTITQKKPYHNAYISISNENSAENVYNSYE